MKITKLGSILAIFAAIAFAAGCAPCGPKVHKAPYKAPTYHSKLGKMSTKGDCNK